MVVRQLCHTTYSVSSADHDDFSRSDVEKEKRLKKKEAISQLRRGWRSEGQRKLLIMLINWETVARAPLAPVASHILEWTIIYVPWSPTR